SGMETAKPSAHSPLAALMFGALVIVLLQRFLPFGPLLLYPFTLLGTWVHEVGHGITAILCGGKFDHLNIYSDASGIAYTAVVPGWRSGVVAAGGLLAPPLLGATLLLLGRRLPRALLVGLTVAMLLSLVLWVRTLVGWVTVSGLMLLLAGLARFGTDGVRLFFVQFVGLLLAMDFVARIDYLFVAAGEAGGQLRQSDVGGMAKALGGPYWFWGGVIAAISAVALLVGLISVWRSAPAPTRTSA
ncbi:MAG: M50 family metallopeptidase, partial [Deltaproteobacteria bacterium]|nr:M50 family metallopeptidase [Deltaproteobacteria bacterium]